MTAAKPHQVDQADNLMGLSPSIAERRPKLSRKPSPTAGNSFTSLKLDWLDVVAADHRGVNPTTFKVAFVVAQFVNGRTQDAWPSQETLAGTVGVSETTLRACLKTLVRLGHLTQEKWGFKNNNKYRLRHQSGHPNAPASKPRET